jgi:site-specific recombinase XerD
VLEGCGRLREHDRGYKLRVVLDPRQSRQPFENVARAWLKARTSKRESSIARDRAIVDHHVLPTLGDRPIGGITRADVQALVDAWTATQAPSTVGRQYSCLRAIFTWAEDSEIITRNPCRAVRLPQVRLVDRPALTVPQLDTLATVLGTDSAPMMWLGTVVGLRWGEVAGL